MLPGADQHRFQEFGADLVTEAARAAMDADHDIAPADAEGGGRVGIEDLADLLHLEVMVARAERAHLVALASAGLFRDRLRLRAFHAPLFLDTLEVFAVAPAAVHRPAGAAREHGVHAGFVEVDASGAAETGRDAAVEGVGQAFLDRLDIGRAAGR